MRSYDPTDFAQHPRKYELFQTARVAQHVLTADGAADLEQGRYVAIKYFRTAWNALRRREEPVYSVTVDGKIWGYLYGNALADFVL